MPEPTDHTAVNLEVKFLPADPADPSTRPCLQFPDGRQIYAFYDSHGVLNVSVHRDGDALHPATETGSCRVAVDRFVVHEEINDLPGWEEMTDRDRGEALIHVARRDRDGSEYAIECYAPSFTGHPRLADLSAEAASSHAAQVTGGSIFDAVSNFGQEEVDRLMELAFAASSAETLNR